MTTLTTADQLHVMMADFQEEMVKLQKRVQVSVHEIFKNFFEQVPEVKQVIWNQYTPYFNDGDECYFSIHEFTFLTEEINPNEVCLTNYLYGGDCMEDEDTSILVKRTRYMLEPGEELSPYAEVCNSLEAACHSAKEFMKGIFGDHVIIIATRKGFETFEYEHD